MAVLSESRRSLNGFEAWTHEGKMIGASRTVLAPENVWLLLHGNAGQAADRGYAVECFSPKDSVFVMEYPGYGKRPGRPGKNSFNEAARQAYLLLRKTYPNVPVCVASESIGSGPACFMAKVEPPPDKIVLVAPFDVLSRVARNHFPGWFVKLVLSNDWNNVAALTGYKRPGRHLRGGIRYADSCRTRARIGGLRHERKFHTRARRSQ